jgi:hypothetical protein
MTCGKVGKTSCANTALPLMLASALATHTTIFLKWLRGVPPNNPAWLNLIANVLARRIQNPF